MRRTEASWILNQTGDIDLAKESFRYRFEKMEFPPGVARDSSLRLQSK